MSSSSSMAFSMARAASAMEKLWFSDSSFSITVYCAGREIRNQHGGSQKMLFLQSVAPKF